MRARGDQANSQPPASGPRAFRRRPWNTTLRSHGLAGRHLRCRPALTGEESVSSILRARPTVAVAVAVTVSLASVSSAHAAGPGSTIRVSVATDGSQGEYFGSREPAISADG